MRFPDLVSSIESVLGQAGISNWTWYGYLADGTIAFSTVCTVFAQENLLGNSVFFPQVNFHPLGGAPILRLRPVEMNTVY